MLKGYCIRHKPTGFLMTGTKYSSRWEPTKQAIVPKLYPSERSAKAALTQWLAGVHSYYWEDGFFVDKKEHRKKEDMEIVTLALLEIGDRVTEKDLKYILGEA